MNLNAARSIADAVLYEGYILYPYRASAQKNQSRWQFGVAMSPVVQATDQPLVEPEVRRSANGVLSTNLQCSYAYRDIGGTRLYLRSYEGVLPRRFA